MSRGGQEELGSRVNKQTSSRESGRVGADEEFGEDMAVGRIGKHTSVIK